MSLDEPLRQKLQQVYVNFHDGKRPLSTYLEAVAQVFSDAGYIQPKEMHPLDLAHELGFMTGQEWYDRFEKQQLTLLAYFLGLSGIPTIPVTDWVKGKNEAEIVACKMALESLKMARKASNLDAKD